MQHFNEASFLNSQPSPSDQIIGSHLRNRHRYPGVLCSSYPSPPMSRPTTPTHEVSEKQNIATSTTELTSVRSETVPTTAPSPLSRPFSNPSFERGIVATASPVLVGEVTTHTDADAVDRFPAIESSSRPDTELPGAVLDSDYAVAGPSTVRSIRKAKQHVASACVNCKRAHLSCDVRRPCQRCINTGKQDTCHDVQHKKRGRPRLREDTDITLPSVSTQPTTSSMITQTQHRPIASTRSRRAESFRSHQSRGSESSSYGPVTPNSATFSPLYAPYQFVPSNMLPAFETPTALLDLDLRVLRFNPSFQQLVGNGRPLLSARLSDIIAPMDNSEPLLSMRDRLRAEREQREPSFLPPIVQSGRDPLDSVQDSDLDRLTQGFSDVTYRWTFQAPLSPATTYPVRVRLGKALTYFVAVTLPPMQIARPMLLQTTPAHLAMSTAVGTDMYAVDRQTIVPSAPLVYDQLLFTSPRATHYSTSQQQYLPQQTPPILVQPFPPRHIVPGNAEFIGQQSHMTQQGQQFVRLAADPRIAMTSREQLPPIAEATTVAPRLAANVAVDETASGDDIDEDQAQTAKRRRGMGIDDVLQ